MLSFALPKINFTEHQSFNTLSGLLVPMWENLRSVKNVISFLHTQEEIHLASVTSREKNCGCMERKRCNS